MLLRRSFRRLLLARLHDRADQIVEGILAEELDDVLPKGEDRERLGPNAFFKADHLRLGG